MAGKLKITIDENGDCIFEVSGIEGSSCETFTDALIRAQGEVEETEKTEEYVLERPDFLYTGE